MRGTAQDRLGYPIEGYVGTKGSGKTYGGLKRAKPYVKQLRLRINKLDPTLAQGAFATDSLETAAMRLIGRNRGIICLDRPAHLAERDWAERAARIAMTAGETLFFMDEAHRYCDRNFRKSQPWLDDILTRNYHVRTPVFWTSTAPRQMSPEFRQQSDRMHIFKSREPVFLSYVQEIAGKRLAEQLKAAPDYHHVLFGPKIEPQLAKPL